MRLKFWHHPHNIGLGLNLLALALALMSKFWPQPLVSVMSIWPHLRSCPKMWCIDEPEICTGGVYHFDANGAQHNTDGWSQCLTVAVVKASGAYYCQMWDTLLMEFFSYYCRSQTSYSEVYNNCFDFVLQFLQLFLRTFVAEMQDADRILTWDTITSKERFCSAWVLPQTRRASRYISLYRQLLREGFVIDTSGSCVQTESSQQVTNVESYSTHL